MRPVTHDAAGPARRLLAGRYRLGAPLGQGGMGTVWAARDEVLGRDVAVKEVVPPPQLDAVERETLRRRTIREAQAAARVSNPCAVTVFDVVEEDGRPWVVMERLPTRSLADVVREEGPLPPDAAARIGLSVLSALTAAHEAGVLHRDVKPSNVLVDDDGRAVLADFGIATLDGDPTITSTGMLVGSPAYMAPERACGEPPDQRSDLWSLGATLYAAVEGRPPFERGTAVATLAATVSDDIPPAERAGPLEPIVRALLAKDPSERPERDEIRTALDAVARPVADKAPTTAPAPAALPAPGDRTQAVPAVAARRRRPGWPVALVAAVALGIGSLAAYDAARDDPAPDRSAAGQRTASPAPEETSPEETSPEETSPEETSTATTTPTIAAGGEPTTPTQGSEENAPPETSDEQVPEGFRLHEDPTGFAIAVPAGWERSTEGPRTYFREPQGGRYLMVDQTTEPKPDALADWEANEQSAAQRFDDYQRVSLDRVDYRDYDAADWEFTYAGGNGRIHVLNRNVRVSDERAYALYLSAPESQWSESREVFDVAAATFRPAD